MGIVALCQRYCPIAPFCYAFGPFRRHIVAGVERDIGGVTSLIQRQAARAYAGNVRRCKRRGVIDEVHIA